MAAAPTIFTAHAVTDGPSDSLRLVPHRFCWEAYWFGALWLLRHRMWIAAVVVLVFYAAVLVGLAAGALAPGAALLLFLLSAILLGLEAQEWRRRALARRGAPVAGFGYGADETDAFTRLAFADRAPRTEAAP